MTEISMSFSHQFRLSFYQQIPVVVSNDGLSIFQVASHNLQHPRKTTTRLFYLMVSPLTSLEKEREGGKGGGGVIAWRTFVCLFQKDKIPCFIHSHHVLKKYVSFDSIPKESFAGLNPLLLLLKRQGTYHPVTLFMFICS